MARLLTLPAGATGGPTQFTPSGSDLSALAAALSGIPTDVVINQAGEGMSAEYPDSINVGSYVLNGGIYIDWCGWPMYYQFILEENYIHGTPTYTWANQDGNRFMRFLQSMGVDSAYVISFTPKTYGTLYQLLTNCPSPKYPRMCISAFSFPAAGSVIISPSITETCPPASQVAQEVFAYSIIGVQAGNGWYFWAFGSNSGAHVSVAEYASFINTVLGTSSGTGQTLQQKCEASGGVWYQNQCMTQAEYQCIASGGVWSNGACTTKGGSVTPPATTTNWPLIIGGGVVLVGIVVAAVALTGGE